MTFTRTRPTAPAYYAWKMSNAPGPEGVRIGDVRRLDGRLLFFSHGFSPVYVEALGGFWCRLFPAGEIGKAFYEGLEAATSVEQSTITLWKLSRAKRVAEGLEG